jgi:hypothetical protein
MPAVAPLAAARAAIGILAALRALEAAIVMPRVLAADRLALPLLPAFPRLPPDLVPLWILLWVGSGLALAWGWRPRVSGGVLAIVLWSTLAMDQQFYGNHLYLLALVSTVLAFGAASRRGGPGRPEAAAVLKVQVSIVYAYSALAKLNLAWLSGAVLAHYSVGPLARAGGLSGVYPAAALLTPLIELGLAVALWSRWYRQACIVGVLFHLGCIMSLAPQIRYQLAIFSGTMIALYPLFAARKSPCASS